VVLQVLVGEEKEYIREQYLVSAIVQVLQINKIMFWVPVQIVIEWKMNRPFPQVGGLLNLLIYFTLFVA
jgi:hypothetical protein